MLQKAQGQAQAGTAPAVIVADYARPAALMVPHYDVTLLPLLEEIALLASAQIGVILLSGDPERSHAFVAAQTRPERFSVISASYDTPWIRDRAPIALRKGRDVEWVLPRMRPGSRERDDRLFVAITARAARPAPLYVAQGNLVAGPRGLALSTTRILADNGCDAEFLQAQAPAFGIRRWIVFDGFPDEPTGHADVHARFLRADLLALAWHPRDATLQARALAVEAGVRAAEPRMRCLRIPLARDGGGYASLVNWVQIGRHLLLPRFETTPDADFAAATAALQAEGFRVHPVASPTLELGGSLHCLTASVFV